MNITGVTYHDDVQPTVLTKMMEPFRICFSLDYQIEIPCGREHAEKAQLPTCLKKALKIVVTISTA